MGCNAERYIALLCDVMLRYGYRIMHQALQHFVNEVGLCHVKPRVHFVAPELAKTESDPQTWCQLQPGDQQPPEVCRGSAA